MKKSADRSRWRPILLTIAAVLFIVFVLLPLSLSLFDDSKYGNVALIPVEGVLTVNGASYLGSSTVSSTEIVEFIKAANQNSQIKIILLEINSPGGSAVASDEIANAIKNTEKPTVALIREVGASGGYWIASATDHIIANRMSITGSIGVISSYLEFSGLMEQYGVGYERLVAGDKKDLGTPLKKLNVEEKNILQGKLNKIHDFFIQGVAENRGLSEQKVREISTGEFYLGVEALDSGLVDQLGSKEDAEQYLRTNYGLEEIDYVVYQREAGFLDMLAGVFSDFSFNMGEGVGSMLVRDNNLILV